jgi:hypothetical protein
MRSFLAGMLLVVALAVAGCGGGGGSSTTTTTGASSNGEATKSAQQVVSDSVKAAEAASSFKMSGQINASGQSIGVDLTIVKGSGAQGSITIKGHTVQLVVVDGYGYMKADGSFWKQFAGSAGTAIAALLQDKWLKFPTSNPQFGSITTIADSKALFDQFNSNTGSITNSGATMYQGENVVAIAGGPTKGTFYVASTGTAYPVALVKTGSSGSGAIMFSNWNEPVTITAPSGAIDVSQLGSGG